MFFRGTVLALITSSRLVSVRADVNTRIPDATPRGFEEWVSTIVRLYFFFLYFIS